MQSVFPGSANGLFDLLFRQGLEPALLGRPDGTVMAANAEAQALLGYSEEEICRLGRGGLVDQGDDRLRAALAERTHEGRARSHLRMRRSDGSVFEAELNSTEFEAEGGRFTFNLLRSVEPLRLAEQARDRSEARLRFALEAAQLGDWDLDLRTNAARRSLLHDRCFGYPAPVAEWGYRTFLAHVLPADQERVDTAFKDAMAGRGEYDLEFRTTWADGSAHWLWTKGGFQFDADGTPARVAGIVADVTERKNAENRLRRSEANLVASQRIAHLGSWELDLLDVEDLTEGALRWSSEVFRIWGYEPGGLEVTYENFLKAVHPDDRGLIGAAVSAALRESRSYDLTHRITRPDGTERIVREQAEFQFDPSGRPYRMIGTVLDVTDSVRAERTLQRALERLNEAQRIGRIGDWEWNLGASEISWSPTVFEVFGRDPRLGAPKSVEEIGALLEPASARLQQEQVNRALETGESQQYELVVAVPGGERRFIQAMAFARKDPGGKVLGLYGTVQDITERKRLEQQFLRAQRMEGIGTLAAGIAHDLNNVLAPILMSLEFLRGRLPEDDDQQLLDLLEQSGRRGADLVKQVLSFARGVEGERVTVNVLHLVRDLLKVVRETFPRSIAVQLTSSEPLFTVKGDATQLHQVLLNLCVNARDAMPAGGKLHVSVANAELGATFLATSPQGRPGSYLKVSVEDTGTGIPPELQARIFEPFFTTKELGQGTGLGLSTTEAIVKSHGGFIAVVSEVGRGARFEVYLPAEASPAHPHSQPLSQPLPRGNGELVLVVDDEEAVCKVAERLLGEFGYRAVLACNGAEAVGVYAMRREEIAAVLTDFSMPVMNGAALATALRTINPAVRIIGSSGLASAEAEVLRAGAQAFLPKPYDTGALLEAVRRVLSLPAV